MSTASRAVLAAVVCALIAAAVVWRQPLRRALVAFFSEESGPFNLAVFRIVFFSVALVTLPDRRVVAQYAQLPHALIFAPHNLGKVLARLPIEATWINVAYVIAVVSCVLGILGLWTRAAAGLYVLASFYYLGIPQLYGKIDHYHFLLWFAFIFALSRSSDALSIGAAIRAARRPLGDPITDPPRGREYALPLRFTWLLMGFIYLFPGLSKYRFDGLRWLAPGTTDHWMHLVWFQTGYRPPFVHPDQIPALMVAGAAFTLLFENGFILLVLFRRTRPLAALAGLAFHNSTYYTMRISFWPLQFMYVSLIDWERISNWAFARRPGLTFAYDGNCGVCKRTVAVLQTIAFPGAVAFVNALDEDAMARARLPVIEERRLLSDIHVFVDGDVFVGYDAYRRLAWRSPILWPLLPVLALPPTRSLGNRVYRRVADHRSCAVSEAPSEAVRVRRVRTAPLVAACTGLLAILFALGATGLRDYQANRNAVAGWPLAIFPTFAGVSDQTTRTLSLRAQTSAGTTATIDLRRRLAFMSSGRRAGLIDAIVGERDPRRRDRALRALLNYARAGGRRLQRVTVVEQRVSIDPSHMGRVLESRPLMQIGA